MKQTAVEWLQEQIAFESYDKKLSAIWDEDTDLSEYFEQAKEIEKEQIIKARATARRLGALGGAHYLSEADEYYNETFKSE